MDRGSSSGKGKSKSRVQSGPLRHAPAARSSRYSPVTDRRKTTFVSVDAPSVTRKDVEEHTPASTTACARVPSLLEFSEVKGDLFSCPPSSSLAHCVSEDMAMGKGVAVLFKKEFGGVGDLKAQGVKPGGVAVLKRKGRFIYYLVTKKRFFHKPTYESFRSSLEAMKVHCSCNGVKELCMPRIGCGLDKLDWGRVTAMIRSIFKDLEITITVYYL